MHFLMERCKENFKKRGIKRLNYETKNKTVKKIHDFKHLEKLISAFPSEVRFFARLLF